MKKVVLSLGLSLILTCWGWQGYSGFGASPAFGQPPPPGYYDPYYCDPNYYYNCYSAPYVDPNAQYFLYYLIPQIGEELQEQQERERHERYEHRGHEGREYYDRR